MEAAVPVREEPPQTVSGGRPGSPPETAEVSRPFRAVVNVVVVLLVTVSIVHMMLVCLHVAPSNAISQRYEKQIDSWIYPYFEQDWRLFAPNPDAANRQIAVRTRKAAVNGTTTQSDWFDLTALDTAAIRHDPFPSHTSQNTLRRAWSAYLDANGSDDRTGTKRAVMMRRYLRDIAVHRLAGHAADDFDAIQIRIATRPIAAGPARPVRSNPADIRYLPWWKVTPDAR